VIKTILERNKLNPAIVEEFILDAPTRPGKTPQCGTHGNLLRDCPLKLLL